VVTADVVVIIALALHSWLMPSGIFQIVSRNILKVLADQRRYILYINYGVLQMEEKHKMISCKLCVQTFDSDTLFHKHLRSHKITQCEYYQKYFPRFDAYDKSIILYKNKEHYFNTDFNSKDNFKRWFGSVDLEVKKLYVREFLIKRKQKKSLIYAPSQIELRTLMMPGIRYINEKLGGYKKLCNELGLINRFSQGGFDSSKFKDVSKKVIFTDSREQTPLKFDNQTRKDTLSFGDYRMTNSNIYIERKSLGDAWGTLTGGYERFEREIVRAKEAGAYLIVLVESAFNTLEEYPKQRQVYGKIKIPVELVYHNIRELMQKYDDLQFLFVDNRKKASEVIQKLFSVDEQVRKVDLQLLYDINQL